MGDHRRSPPPRMRADLHMPTYYAAGTVLFSLSSLCAQPFVLLKRRQQVGLAPSDAGTFRALGDIARSEGIVLSFERFGN